MRPLLAVLAATVLALVPAGCGGDDERDPPSTAPALTVPETDPVPEPAPTTTSPQTQPAPQPTPAPEPDGGAQAPAAPQQTTPDSPENDVPPPQDSPAERFEEFCQDNPGACG